ncbi:MAG: hypothetical protein ACF8LL_00210, partial [Phycisphaerales bacterium]
MSDQTPEPADLNPAADVDSNAESATEPPPRGAGDFGPRRPYREVTLSALVLALLIGIVMNAS